MSNIDTELQERVKIRNTSFRRLTDSEQDEDNNQQFVKALKAEYKRLEKTSPVQKIREQRKRLEAANKLLRQWSNWYCNERREIERLAGAMTTAPSKPSQEPITDIMMENINGVIAKMGDRHPSYVEFIHKHYCKRLEINRKFKKDNPQGELTDREYSKKMRDYFYKWVGMKERTFERHLRCVKLKFMDMAGDL